jgi:PAS domain S-box-containing protein
VEALKKSEERFRIVAEAAHVAVYEIELKNQKILYMSDLERLTGYKPPETTWSLNWVINHIHPDDTERVKTTWQHAIANPKLDRYVLEYRFMHKNGQYITLKDTARTIKDATGNAVLVIGGVRDITQRRADQEKIHQYNKHLQELVAERTKQLVDYERFAAMGQVAGMVGHDIRNPLQALTGEMYLIRLELDNIQDPEAKNNITESIDSVDENISYINKIVADLQDYSRKLNPEIEPLNLENLIKGVFATIKLPPKIQLFLDLKAAPEIKADQTFLRRVLTNLINNAIQAMPDGGKLEISGYREDNYACITVTDTGVGIEETAKPKVFTPMFTTKAKGQGLGLAVVKRLVEAQGGTIGFESEVGKGTKFYVKLPLS